MNFSRYKPFLRIIGCVMLLVLSQAVASYVVAFALGGYELFSGTLSFAETDQLIYQLATEHYTEVLLFSYVLILISVFFMARLRKKTFLEYTSLGKKAQPALLILGLLAGLAGAFWSTIAVGSIPWPEQWMADYMEESATLITPKPLLDLIATVFAGPLIEEILFRGLIYESFCRMVPAGAAVIFQGIAFASVHSTPIWMIYAGFMGCLLGYLRKRTGSIWPSLAMHIGFNGASYLLEPWMAEYGNDGAAIAIMFAASAFLLLLAMYGVNYRTRELKK